MDFDFDPFSHELHEDPYSVYAEMRERFPAYHNERLGLWALTRFEDVWTAVHHPETFSSANGISLQEPPAGIGLVPMMIMMDPPRHDQLRNLVKRAFTPRRIAELEPRVRVIARELIDSFIDRGTCDLTAEFAGPLPTTVIAELLGVPAEDRATFRAWSNKLVSVDVTSETLTGAGMEAVAQLYMYFTDVIAQRREAPRDDLVSALIEARVDDEALTDEELVGFCILLLLAGNETTTNLISNATVQLARHPEQRRILIDEPAKMANAVEEFLRYDSPVQALGRIATREVELHGRTVPEGARVALLFGAANRDPREFDDPDRLDVTRTTERHLALGHGIHYCLGASLARLEARVAFEELLARIPDYELATDRVERLHSGMIRGVATLPIAFRPVERVA